MIKPIITNSIKQEIITITMIVYLLNISHNLFDVRIS